MCQWHFCVLCEAYILHDLSTYWIGLLQPKWKTYRIHNLVTDILHDTKLSALLSKKACSANYTHRSKSVPCRKTPVSCGNLRIRNPRILLRPYPCKCNNFHTCGSYSNSVYYAGNYAEAAYYARSLYYVQSVFQLARICEAFVVRTCSFFSRVSILFPLICQNHCVFTTYFVFTY